MNKIFFQLLLFSMMATSWVVAQSSLPDHPKPAQPQYQPITGGERFQWFVKSTVGPESLAAGLFTAGIGTARNHPEEYGGGWEGFGKRYAMRFTGIATSNAMEAGLGSLWGEDPRYFRAIGKPVGGRVKNIISMTFLAVQRDGRRAPAYARFIAIPGNNFLSNTWRADSESHTSDAAIRTLYGFLGHMGGNAFSEFWPDVQKYVFHKRGQGSADAYSSRSPD